MLPLAWACNFQNNLDMRVDFKELWKIATWISHFRLPIERIIWKIPSSSWSLGMPFYLHSQVRGFVWLGGEVGFWGLCVFYFIWWFWVWFFFFSFPPQILKFCSGCTPSSSWSSFFCLRLGMVGIPQGVALMCPFFLLLSAVLWPPLPQKPFSCGWESGKPGFLPGLSQCEEGSFSFLFPLLREWWARRSWENEGEERSQERVFLLKCMLLPHGILPLNYWKQRSILRTSFV